MKKILAVMIGLVFLFTGSAYALEIKLAHVVNEKDAFHVAAEKFKELAEKYTDGKVKPLATLQDHAVTQFPRLETQKADSPNALLVRANLALVVRTGTPQPIIERLYREVKSCVEEPDFIARLQSLAYEPVLSPPVQARKFLQAESARYGAIAKAVNLDAN